ncbi:MAG: global cell cycle regulator GcrA-like protein [Alphaproteobacteria bacterium]|nr:global cell cycle regulator GcrA-like protein [Alphaproteobacteria bacterium]
MSWTMDKIKQLKKLWTKGKSTVEIAKELGISKNSVIGKVHRLDLTARPSPIKKKEVPAPAPVPSKPQPKKKTVGKCHLMDLKSNTCRWPIGEPENEDFHFCGKTTVTGKPYCEEHCKAAYTSLKELADQNAQNKLKAKK